MSKTKDTRFACKKKGCDALVQDAKGTRCMWPLDDDMRRLAKDKSYRMCDRLRKACEES